MNLKNMSPKDRMQYEVMLETKEEFINKLNQGVILEHFEEILYVISRAEYKRGKSDASPFKPKTK